MSKSRSQSPSDGDQSTNDQDKKRKSQHDEIEVNLEAPEPPSKRAKRALKKGKTPTANKSHKKADDHHDLDPDSKPEGTGDKKTKEQTRSEHGIWVGNLAFLVTKTELRQWLIDNSGGSITAESITRLHMPSGTNKQPNKGFAYVDFDSLGPKVAAMALSEQPLANRNLLIKDANSFEGRPAKKKEDPVEAPAGGKPAAEKDESRKIFVGNLSFATSEDDLWTHFEKCGEIDWAKVATFEDTGKCKGYGWVKFREPEAAAWAVKGFVKIKENVETEEDFLPEGQEADPDAPPRKTKMRKWWVNKLRGRALKIELAEDDQVRYKKRFGKDGPKKGADREQRVEAAPANGEE